MLNFAVPVPPGQAGTTSPAFSEPNYEKGRAAFVDNKEDKEEQRHEIELQMMVNGDF